MQNAKNKDLTPKSAERTRGSHHNFRKEGVEEKINLQRDDGKAKAYQVRQVRAVILRYGMGGDL